MSFWDALFYAVIYGYVFFGFGYFFGKTMEGARAKRIFSTEGGKK